MAETKTISAVDLIAKFQYALDNNWGYIWGKAGVLWTKALQDQLNKTTDEDRKYGRKYGSKWIGHYVADCSGLFSWAFKQLGGYMYHGSNTMWLQYCTSKGSLKNGKRTDGKELKPGTAVFTYNSEKKNRGHVGLYIGNGDVIEAQGTQAGVVKSKITNSKWVEWGELKGVDYVNGHNSTDTKPPETTTQDEGVVGQPAKTAIVNGTRVALRASPTTAANVLLRVDKGQRVEVIEDEWTKVKYGGKTGYMMTKFLTL